MEKKMDFGLNGHKMAKQNLKNITKTEKSNSFY